MENATKALIMAGGILLALLVIGALYLMFSNLAVYKDQSDASKKATQIAEFNNQFEPYNKDDLTLMELKSVYNKIESNNALNPEQRISHNILTVYPNIGNDFKELPENDKQNCVFKCTKVGHDSSGLINSMNFKRIK